MKPKPLDFATWKRQMLKDPAFKAEYDKLQPESAVIRAMIEARIKKNLTQTQLAKKLGTKQSVISRLESGKANPSLKILQKLAHALDSHLEIHFIPTR